MPIREPDILAKAAGWSSGTGLASVVLLMHESPIRSALLLATPTVTIGINKAWKVPYTELMSVWADYQIRRQREKAKAILEELKAAGASRDVLTKAKQAVEAFTLLQLENAERRVRTTVQ